MLYDFIQRKEHVLKNLNLPKYEVPWLRVPNFEGSREKDHKDASRAINKEQNDTTKGDLKTAQ